jgi:DNA-binding CsgD family transcriptional regulator
VTVLRERERELGEINAALDEVSLGKGCAVAIEGSAGLGKTRLVQAVREAASKERLKVLSARATDLEQEFPFSLVRQLLGADLSALPTAEREALLEGASAARGALGLDPGDDFPSDPFAVLHGLYWVTAALADRGPLLLAVDDLHLADAGSLDYLTFLLPRLEELPVLLAMAVRPNEPDPSGGVSRVLNDTSVRHLKMAPLSSEGTMELLTEDLEVGPDPAFAGVCYEVTGGNPFLIRELGRSLAEQQIDPVAESVEQVRMLAPERVARMVLTRISRLSPDAAAVARALATLGEDSEPPLVAELAGVDLEAGRRAADELRSVAILDSCAQLRFVHPLIRNSVYADVPAGERAAAHARAAALLRSREAVPERVATQLLASDSGGEDPEAVEVLVAAGERALATGAAQSAVAYLIRAVREPPPPAMWAAVLTSLFTAGFRAADAAAIEGVEAEVLEMLERDQPLQIQLAPQLASWMSLGQGRFDEANRVLNDALEVAAADQDVERAFELEVQLAGLAMLASGGSDTGPIYGLSRYAGRIGSDTRAGRLLAAMEIFPLIAGGTAEEAVDAAGRALANGGVFFSEEPEFIASGMPIQALLLAGELDAARRAAEQALAIARERDWTSILSLGWFVRAMVEFNLGNLAAAEADMRQAIDVALLAGMIPAAVLVSAPPLMEILIERDELEAAEAQLTQYGMADFPIPGHGLLGLLRLARGRLRFERGEVERAAEDFEMLPIGASEIELSQIQIPWVSPLAARALVAAGEQTRARDLAEELDATAKRWGAPSVVAQALRTRAAVEQGAGAIDLLVEASNLLEDSPSKLRRASTQLELGAALRRAGRRADSRPPLREALRLARRCGAVRLAKQVRVELEAGGETVRWHGPIGAESLTPSERRVAELAASGMTNRQIAQSLFVTIKTVEAHLSASYDKLDIESRRHLAEALEAPPDPMT